MMTLGSDARVQLAPRSANRTEHLFVDLAEHTFVNLGFVAVGIDLNSKILMVSAFAADERRV